jgi:hypothetical protein
VRALGHGLEAAADLAAVDPGAETRVHEHGVEQAAARFREPARPVLGQREGVAGFGQPAAQDQPTP